MQPQGEDERRELLRALNGQRHLFEATVDVLGTRMEKNEVPTMLLRDVFMLSHGRDKLFVCNHVWVDRSKLIERAMLSRGERIKFMADVYAYRKRKVRYGKGKGGSPLIKTLPGTSFGLRRVGSIKRLENGN